MNIEKYRALFLEEATDYLGEMTRALSELAHERGTRASASEQAEAIDTLFRLAHSIKGMAASLDYVSVSNLAHALESWLTPARDAGSLSEDAIAIVYEVVGAFEDMLGHVDATFELDALSHAFFDELARVLERLRR